MPVFPAPVAASTSAAVPGTLAPELAALLTTIFQAQADAQQAQANVTNANFIAFHTATAQALAARSGDKDSKLTAMKQRILKACTGQPVGEDFEAEAVYREMALEGGTVDSISRILKRRLKLIPLSPHKTHIHVTPQLIATIRSLNFSANGDRTYAGCTKGITIFTTPWRTAEAINEDLAEDEYLAPTLKSVADVRRHVTSAKVELPTSLLGLVRVLNNYCRLLEELFGPECHHLEHVLAIRDALETHEADLESRLTSTLILHLMWRIHQDARQFFLACEGWDEGESLPRSLLNLTVCHLVEDCHIQTTLSCPETAFLGTQVWAPGGRLAPGTRAPRPAVAAGPQPTVNTAIPPLCQKAVGTFNWLYPSLTITDLCQQGRVKFLLLRIGREGACMNFGLLGRCPGCQYRHEVCTAPETRQASVAKAMEKGMATMKAAGST